MTMRSRPSISEDAATIWARAVCAGEVVAGPHVRNACRRHLDDLQHGAERGLLWDRAAAERAMSFFPDVLRLAGGKFEGRPFVLHPSQQFKIGSIFGWKKADGKRRFRRVYIEEGKGNGKSPLAAGIGMYCLLADGEARAEVYAAASIKSQAMVLFRDAVAMWQQSTLLRKKLTSSGGVVIWSLADLATGSFFRPISSDEAHSGPRPSCALCDEVHEMPSRITIEMLERGFKFRDQPLLVMSTNSGSDRNSVCWEEHQHAVRVAAGTKTPDAEFTYVGEAIDDDTFAFVCALDVGDDPLTDPTCWPKANPLLGTILKPDYLDGVVKQALALPGRLNNILRLHFCTWTDADTAWMSRPALEAVLHDFNPADHSGEDVYAGIDLSATTDLTALAIVVPTGLDENGRPTFDAWVEAWTPGDTLAERALRDQAPYDVWVRQGWLNEVPGRKLIGFDYVAARLAEINSEHPIKELAFDAYGFKKNLEPELDALGLTIPLVEHPQGGKKKGKESELWMPGSKMALETLIFERRIRLRRSPLLISAMMSAAVEGDAFGNFWFSKRRATQRIDPLIALAMAIGAAVGPNAEGVSVYMTSERPDGFLFV